MKEMKTKFLVLALVVLAMCAAATIADAAPPTITISESVGANPATVYTSGQAIRVVNVAWNAGSDYPYCEIYYTVNGANQAELGRDHDGTKALTVSAGSKYEIWMVVYPGNGQYTIVTRLIVVAKQGNPPAPTPPPPSGGGSISPGSVDAVSDKPSDLNTETYRNAPFISDVRVQPDSRNVVISFASTQSAPENLPLVEIGKVAPARDRFGIWTFPFNSGALSRFVTGEQGRYQLDVDATGERLEIGTTYHYIINVFNSNKSDTKRSREQITGQFNTFSQTVKVFWEHIEMVDDSDDLSTAETHFWFWVNYPKGSRCVEYNNADMDTGHNYYPDGVTTVVENAPDKLKLEASGLDVDGGGVLLHCGRPLNNSNDKGDSFGEGRRSFDNFDVNAAKGELDLSKIPGEHVIHPFQLHTSGGSFKFSIFGHLEITRGPAVQTGTTSSPLKTGPEPIKPQRRIPHQPGTPTTPLPICVAAQRARERNSPAAPGLEAQCAAQEPVKPQGRVPHQPGTSTTPLPICVAAQRARERNSPAARGLEEQCLAQQPVKPQRRVPPPSGTPGTPKPICELARQARDRNSPAARGLEVKCLAAKKGEAIANEDPLAVELRDQQPDDYARLGFDIGMAAAEGNTLPGPGKDRICAAGSTTAEQEGCRIAVLFSVERNRNAKFAETGAQIALADPAVAEARDAETDVFYRLGFDIATGIYGDPALGAQANTAPGPIRDSLSAAGKSGFDASLKLHLGRNYKY
jgi:hypothetical protein